tara:strand:+ start:121 stop:504 length:384 start_codon:yes stop_codon:yes gene_type:complete
MEFKLLPRETVIIAKNSEQLINWYVDNLNFSIVHNNLDIKYCYLKTDSGINIAITQDMGNKSVSKRIGNKVILQFCTNNLKELFKSVKKNGGSVVFGPSYDEEGEYWYGSIADPEGNEIWFVDQNCP